jgi:uncharacterized protein YbjT (DUF2867 family)
MDDRIVLITGITGKQGGAVARALLGQGFDLRGMTRHPDGEAARAWRERGVDMVPGDLDDETSLAAALAGAWGAYAVQNTWEAGVEREEQQGLRMAQLAKEAGVQHYVQASVGSAERHTGIPHFDNKWRIEEEVRRLAFPSHAILRPVFFMENLVSPGFLQGDELRTALPPATRLQMVAVPDIGRVGARMFTDAERMNGRAIELAGDSVTMPQAAEALSRAMGRHVKFVELPIEGVRQFSADVAAMLEWFRDVGYAADIPALEREFGPMLDLDQWASEAVHVTA